MAPAREAGVATRARIHTIVSINGLTGFLCGLQGAFITAIGLLWAGRYARRQQTAQ